MPGGRSDPLHLFPKAKLTPAKREKTEPEVEKPAHMSPGQIAAINDGNEPMIKDMIQQGFGYYDFEKMIDPASEPKAKENIVRAVANSFSAVFGRKKPKITLTPAKRKLKAPPTRSPAEQQISQRRLTNCGKPSIRAFRTDK